jgi:RNA polymerase sigma-70 factor (ECF subfamily)
MSSISISPSGTPLPSGRPDEQQLVAALQSGDIGAFETLVDRYHASLVRFARAYLGSAAAAEESVQETWLALVKRIHAFEGRSSLKTWLFRVLTYHLIAQSSREHRDVSFADLGGPVPPRDRFLPDGHVFAGHWAERLPDWHETPEESLIEHETLDIVRRLIGLLPPRQKLVLILRDVEGLPVPDICATLNITVETQRVLLHRARSRVREGLATYLAKE